VVQGAEWPKDALRFSGSVGQGASLVVAVKDLPLVHTTQLLPLDASGDLVRPGDFNAQAEQVLDNLAKTLAAAGSSLSNTVKLNAYVKTMEGASNLDAILAKRFSGAHKPAVTCVISELQKPDALVAIDAIALAAASARDVRWLQTPEVYTDKGISTAAVLPAGPKIYISGMADTNALPQATTKTLDKLISALVQLKGEKADIVQLKAFLEPMTDAGVVRNEIVKFFDGKAPPLVLVEWRSPRPNPPIEIELIAMAKGNLQQEPESVTFLTPPGTTSTKVFSRVARVNHGTLLYFSGFYSQKPRDGASQSRDIFEELRKMATANGSDLEHLVKATYYVSDDQASKGLNDVRPEFLNPQRPPAASKVMVRGVGLADRTVLVDMIAVTK